MSRLPISDYGLLSDCRTAALVSLGGSIDWLCFPRFDSTSLFGGILDDSAGHWSIHPADGTSYEASRRYLDGTMVLATTFTTASGSATLIDALAVGGCCATWSASPGRSSSRCPMRRGRSTGSYRRRSASSMAE